MAIGDTFYIQNVDASGNIIRQKMISQGGSPETWALAVGGTVAIMTATITRPNDTTTYAVGDMIGASTTAGSGNILTFSGSNGKGLLRVARIRVDSASLPTGVTIRLHLFSVVPSATVGDNGALVFTTGAGNVTGYTGYLGYVDVTIDTWFADGAAGKAEISPNMHINQSASSFIYGILEDRTIFTPAASKTFTVELSFVGA